MSFRWPNSLHMYFAYVIHVTTNTITNVIFLCIVSLLVAKDLHVFNPTVDVQTVRNKNRERWSLSIYR